MSNCSYMVNVLSGVILVGVVGLILMCFLVSNNLKAEMNQIEVRKHEEITNVQKREDPNP